MKKFWVDNDWGSTISLKPGETKVIYPRNDSNDFAGVLLYIYN
jgi:hypothetical protein